jgi:hypothetical protein
MPSHEPPTLLTLPAELRLHIVSYLLSHPSPTGFLPPKPGHGITLDNDYTATHSLTLLLVCRTFYQDLSTILFAHTHFVTRDMYSPLSTRLFVLHPAQIAAIRNLAWVAGPRQFGEMVQWHSRVFDFPLPSGSADAHLTSGLRLDTLRIVLHHSSYWHYLSDFTSDLVSLLRRLEGVRKLIVVKNGANVKGSFKTWYNRLVGLILKVDHTSRYDQDPPVLEKVWWEWNYDDRDETIELTAQERRRWWWRRRICG